MSVAALAPIALGVGLAGTAMSTYSQVQAARAGAKMAGIEAESIEDTTRAQEESYRRQADKVLGKQRAIGAASGLDISSGSPLLQALDSAKEAELSALSIRHRGKLGAMGKRYEASQYKRAIPGIIAGGVAQSGSLLGGYIKGK